MKLSLLILFVQQRDPPTKRPTSSTLSAALRLVDARVRETINDNQYIAATYLRLGFHDCLPNGVAGGCDGCLNLANPANFGLLPAVEALAPVVEDLEDEALGLSRADIWAYAVLVAAEVSQDDLVFTDNFKTGRKNCEAVGTCSSSDPSVCAMDGPDTIEDFPSTSFTTHELLDYFRNHFGFNAAETVAIMGAHTMGRALIGNSGFRGNNGWVTNTLSLDNEYFTHLVGPPEDRLKGPPYWQVQISATLRYQWIRVGEPFDSSGTTRPFMMNTDMAIIRDFEAGGTQHLFPDGRVDCLIKDRTTSYKRCPASETLAQAGIYRDSNAVWLSDFKKVLITMLEKGLQ
ncbi:peroxidase [Fragilaria crotonensis]|nr:peroxidase [Fragilaria crotonensis]